MAWCSLLYGKGCSFLFRGFFLLLLHSDWLPHAEFRPSKRDQGMLFSFVSLLNSGISLNVFGVSFEFNSLVVVFNLPVLYIMSSISTLSGDDTGAHAELQASFNLFTITSYAVLMIFCLLASRAWSFRERAAYQLEHFHNETLNTLRHKLFDLVPPQYAKLLVVGCKYIEPCHGRAVVLQLDVCNFTVHPSC